MAYQHYVRSFIGPDGNEFFYASPYEWDRDGFGDEVQQHNIPTGSPSGGDGEYQGDSTQSARPFGIKGTVLASGPANLQNLLDALFAAHPEGGAGKFRRKIVEGGVIGTGVGGTVLSDRYIECRVTDVTKGAERGLPSNRWGVNFRAARPGYLDWNLITPIALTTATNLSSPNNLLLGGNRAFSPVFTFVVTSPGLIQVVPSKVRGAYSAPGGFVLNAAATGTYVVDSLKRRITRGGVINAIASTASGGFFDLPPTLCAVSVVLPASGGATLASASMTGQPAWAFS